MFSATNQRSPSNPMGKKKKQSDSSVSRVLAGVEVKKNPGGILGWIFVGVLAALLKKEKREGGRDLVEESSFYFARFRGYISGCSAGGFSPC